MFQDSKNRACAVVFVCLAGTHLCYHNNLVTLPEQKYSRDFRRRNIGVDKEPLPAVAALAVAVPGIPARKGRFY